MKLKTTIPFAGFYESIHSEAIDFELEQMNSDDQGNIDQVKYDQAFDSVKWGNTFINYAKDYTNQFASELNLDTLDFLKLDSPREYNFGTDRIFCTIELSEVEKIYKLINAIALRDRVRELFTSRSGFISHYPNSLDEWPKDLSQWDCNQVGTLIEVYSESENFKEEDLLLHEIANHSLDY